MSPSPVPEMAIQRSRRSAVVKTGTYSNKSSFEPQSFPQISALLRKPARREDQSSVRPEQAIWESQSVAVCSVSPSGEIVRANLKFLEMVGVGGVEPGMADALGGLGLVRLRQGRTADARELLAQSDAGARVNIESIAMGANGETLWLVVPASTADERSHVAFRLLHDSVAQSVAALAMNLFLVQQSGATSSYPNAEKILRSSLELVEQCAREVRGICTLLQRQSKQAGRNCA